MRTAVVLMGLLAAASLALAGEVSFTAKPTSRTAGDAAGIAFAVSAPTDAEVAILDAKGKVVRHLAAGVLGKDAPAPLQKNSLSQELAWDGRDDAGRPAAGGPFRARVRLGLQPTFDRIVGWDPNTMTGAIVGLAVNERGEAFVLDADARMKVFDREGRYLRTIMPYPAATPRERLESVGQLEIEGQRIPVVYNAHPAGASVDSAGSVYPLTTGLVRQQMAVGPRGVIYLASALGTYVHHGLPRHLLALSEKGGAPEGMNFVGPRIREPNNFLGGAGERGVTWMDHLAVSPDGRWVYLNQAGESSRFRRSHAVFRLQWSDGKPGEPFLGQAEPGEDEAHFNNPQGIAADKAGRLYVCDWGNNRVVIFSAEGKRLGQFPVNAPEQIAVHPATGSIYLVSRQREPKRNRPAPDTTLRKFSAWGPAAPKEEASLAVKTIELIALDAAAGPPVIWAATSRAWSRPYDLVRIIDRGDAFDVGDSVVNQNGLEHPANIAADPARGRLIVRERDHAFLTRELIQVNLATGQKKRLLEKTPPGPVFALDGEGNIYVAADYNRDGIDRFDPQGRPLPFSALETNHIGWPGRNPHWPRGITVGPDGRIYVLRNIIRHQAGQIDVFGPDGKLVQSDPIRGLDRGACGVGVDAAGNIYVAVNLKRKDQPYPPAFTGKVPARAWWFWYDAKRHPLLFGDRPAPWSYTFYNPYLYHWGSIVKFGPEGGAFYGLRPRPQARGPEPQEIDPFRSAASAPAGAEVFTSALFEQEVRLVGARWVRQGYGPVASQHCRWGDPGCCCATSGFAVDLYGRVFYPNVFRFCVEALDGAGNLLARIGRYGNVDEQPAAGAPDCIPFAWPCFVAAADGRLYVSDAISQRVVVVRLDCRVTEFCDIGR